MRTHIYPLDLLRFLAACSVASYHLGYMGWAAHWGTTVQMLQGAARYEPLVPFTWFGWIGVEIFFVISGFVIANSAHGRMPADFLKGRVLRLYPAAWICATLSLFAWLVFAGAPLSSLMGEYARSLSLWILGPWIDGVYWSLAVEVVFYALVFWVLAAGRWFPLTALPWVLVTLSFAYVVLMFIPGAATWLHTHPVFIHAAEPLLLRHGCYFAAGIWLWLMSRRQMTPPRYAGLLIAITGGLAGIVLQVRGGAPTAGLLSSSTPMIAPLTVWLLAIGLIVVVARAPRLFDVESPRVQVALKRVGLMTYPLFLIHNVVGAGIIRTAVHFGVDQWAALLLAVFTILMLAYVISATLEVEVRKRLRVVIDTIETWFRTVAVSPRARP